MTEIEYTDSALNDTFVKFFKTFKLGQKYLRIYLNVELFFLN